MKLLLLVLSTLSFVQLFSQKRVPQQRGKAVSVVFKELDITIENPILHDTLRFKRDSINVKIVLYDLKGKSYVECYNNNNTLLAKGNYINSLALLSEYRIVDVLIPKSKSYIVFPFYQPLKDGEWIIFDSKKQEYLKKEYSKGVDVK